MADGEWRFIRERSCQPLCCARLPLFPDATFSFEPPPLMTSKRPQHLWIDVMEESGELLLLPLPCSIPYAVQRMGHTFPVLRPARALLVRIPLGSCPWLPLLRHRYSGVVRKLRCYYGRI